MMSAVRSKLERIQQLRRQYQHTHRERRGRYLYDEQDDVYEQRLKHYEQVTSTDTRGQLSLLSCAGLVMSTGQSAVMLCGWGVKAGMVHSACGWQVKLCDRSLTHAMPERFRDECHIHYRVCCTNVLLILLT